MKKHFFLYLILLLLFSCQSKKQSNKKEEPITLQPTVISQNYSLWGVTRYSDLKIREELKDNSPVLRYINQGALLEIIKRNEKPVLFDGKKNYWYQVKTNGLIGWIFGSYIYIFPNLEAAEQKCEEILFSSYEKPLY